jgi:Domain of unknown function (DUF1918)
MIGKVGDRLIIKRRNTGAPSRDGQILEVHGRDDAPPYLVQWSDDGSIGLVFPDSDAHIEHLAHSAMKASSNPSTPTNAI